MNWYYEQPVKIEFGVDKRKLIPQIAIKEGYHRGILICDSFFKTNGVADKFMSEFNNTLVAIFSDISPNPDVSEVDACYEAICNSNADFIVALGGGSALDCAKAASVIAKSDKTILKYFDGECCIPKEHLPIIALPTTAGTGSEVTNVSVLTDRKRDIKKPLSSHSFYPEYAIIDPVLTYSMPAKVTACSGIDVLCHALESYWSKNHQPICEALSIYAIRSVFAYLPVAFCNPQDTVAREKMAEAALIAGLAFGFPKTNCAHVCSYPISSLYHLPHGEACGLTIDYFTKINAENDRDGRLHSLAVELGFSSAVELAAAIKRLKSELNLHCDLKEFHLTNQQIRELAIQSMHPNMKNNPTEITQDMLVDMYRSLC